MLTSIEIENFRAIRDPIRIDLAPVTLLFGANSVGKSSILSAAHLRRPNPCQAPIVTC